MNRRAIGIAVLYAVLAVLVIPVYPHFVSPNEFTRWALAASLVEYHTTEVTRVAPRLGPRFEDFAEIDGRVYSNKAPGAALLGTVGYLAARPFTTSIRILVTAMRLVASALPLVLLAFLMIRLATRFGIPERAPLVVVTLLFATPLLAYGLLLFAHALVAAALFAAWAFLFVEERPLLAGALIGLAVLSEYPAAVPGLVLLIIAASDGRWKRTGAAIAGGVPFALALAAYHFVSFGSAFRLPYGNDQNAAFRALSRSGFYGIELPSVATIARFFFDPGFGLFVLSPVLILSIMAAVRMRCAMRWRPFAAFLLAPLSTILLYSGYPNWQGGWSVGPRYIVSVIPFFAFALLFGKRNRLEPLLLGFSVAAVALISLVFPFVPLEFSLPWGTLSLPLLTRGLVAPNLLHLVWRPAAIAVPLLLVAAAVAAATGRRGWIAAAGAVLAAGIGVFAAMHASPRERIERAYIADVYFEQSGALERSLPRRLSPASPIFRRRAVEMRLPPGPWPF